MEGTFDGVYFNNNDAFLTNLYGYRSNVDCESETYGSFTQSESCPSTSSSFVAIDETHFRFEDVQRDSLVLATLSLSSPNGFATSTGSETSPLTPIGSQPNNQWYSLESWAKPLQRDLWPPSRSDSEGSWLSTGESLMQNFEWKNMSQPDSSTFFSPKPLPLVEYSTTYPDISLARAIFPSPDLPHGKRQLDHIISWSDHAGISHPQTVEPCQTLQTMIPSSPCTRLPSTPLKQTRNSSASFLSSPIPKLSPSVLASQWDVDETKYFSPSTLPKYEEQDDDYVMSSSPPAKRAKRSVKPSSCPVKSGMDCDPVIPPNTFACPWPGCDKGKGKPSTFKRQEHMKRHVKTVHEKGDEFTCWVPACKKAFTRRDNLKSHQIKTHGRRTANSRNNYVATMDANSKYFDKAWEGQLTSDGLPVGHPEHPEIR